MTITFSQDPNTLGVSGVIRYDDKVFNLVHCSLTNPACVALVEEEVEELDDFGLEVEQPEVSRMLFTYLYNFFSSLFRPKSNLKRPDISQRYSQTPLSNLDNETSDDDYDS